MGGWTYNSGQFNLYCDVCAKKIKAEESKHRWDGLIVCADDWEERQPQDFVKARTDKITIPFSRPVEDTSTDITYGMFDVVYFRENPVIGKYISLALSDEFIINDSDPLIALYYNPSDAFSLSETVIYTFSASIIHTDEITTEESGWISMNDYVEPGYFLEEYVGLKYSF